MPATKKQDLTGLVVAITGGGRGIGLEIARSCHRAGMSVAIGDLDETLVQEAAAEIGPDVLGLSLDVRDESDFRRFLDTVEAEQGPLHALVNNAGVLRMGPFSELAAQDVQLQLDVNIGGVLTGTRLALDRMLPRDHGHIVNMASSAGMIATANGAVYSATKHAVLGFTRALRGELRDTGVKTSVVMPGVIRTEMTADFNAAMGVRVVEPSVVADRVVEALRTHELEVCVPKEIAVQGRLFSPLPAGMSDSLKRLTRADAVMH